MPSDDWPRTLLIVSSLIWIGMLLGVSFLATPVKFLAPSLTLPVALDVGRQTFNVFTKLELIGSITLLSAAALYYRKTAMIAITASIGGLVVSQVFWLLPVLDERVVLILQGDVPAESQLHSVYVVIEAAKVLLLSLVAWISWTGTAASSRLVR